MTNREVRHGGGDQVAEGLRRAGASEAGEGIEGRGAGAAASGSGVDLRRRVAERSGAAKIGDVGLQTVRDWVTRFNDHGPEGLIDGKAPGHAPKLSGEHRRALKDMVETGPIPSVHGVVRWRLIDLMQWLNDEYGVSLSEPTMSREMRAMGFRKLSARKRHYAQDERTLDAFKTSAPRWRRSARVSIPA